MSLKPDYLKELARVVEREVSADHHILESRYTPRKKELAYGDLKVGNSLHVGEYVSLSEGIHDEMLLEIKPPKELVMFHSGRNIGKSMISVLYKKYLQGTSLEGKQCQRIILDELSDLPTISAAVSCNENSSDPVKDAFSFFSNQQPNQVKESNKLIMQQTNIRVETLIGLASANNTDEFSKYDQMPEGIKEVLKRKAKEQADAKVEAAAETILSLVNKADAAIQERVEIIRQLRRREKLLKEEITQIETAKEYGMSSQNFLPLARGLGYHVMQVEQRELLSVPSNFKMKAAKK